MIHRILPIADRRWLLLVGWLVIAGCTSSTPNVVVPSLESASPEVIVELPPLPQPTRHDQGIGVVRIPVDEFLTAIQTNSTAAPLESEIKQKQAAGQTVISLDPVQWRSFFSTCGGNGILNRTGYRIYCPNCDVDYGHNELSPDSWHFDYWTDPRGHRLFRWASDITH